MKKKGGQTIHRGSNLDLPALNTKLTTTLERTGSFIKRRLFRYSRC